jgi:mannose-6-phosphate isomerase-like protein (cupin superfamily)
MRTHAPVSILDLAEAGERLSLATLAEIAAGFAACPDWWHDKVVEDPTGRTGVRVVATDEYDAWLLRWPAITGVSPHDHGDSAGAFAVVSGELVEYRWCGVVRSWRLVGRGEVVTVGAGVVHDVVAGAGPTLSVHVYSPPLTTMSFYDDTGQVLISRGPVPHGGASSVILGS